MIDTQRLLKVSSVWISIVYVVCYVGVAMYPASREMFMRYSLHSSMAFDSNFFSIGYFVSGLIIWNIVIAASALLFAGLFNRIK